MYSQIIKEGFLNLETVPEAKPLTNRGTFHKRLTLIILHPPHFAEGFLKDLRRDQQKTNTGPSATRGMPRPNSLGAYSPLKHTTTKHNTTPIFDQKGRADSERTQIVVKNTWQTNSACTPVPVGQGCLGTNKGPRVRGDKHVTN